jgi:hypothetical protein
MTMTDATIPSPVVPTTIQRPKRIAKTLAGYYPASKLVHCQAVTARMYGFPDWHALENAVKRNPGSGPFDDDVSQQVFSRRIEMQMGIVARDLGKVDLQREYPPPVSDPFDTMGSGRLKQAGFRMEQRLARDAVCKLRPTAREHPEAIPPLEAFCIIGRAELETLPNKLSAWWIINVPHQPEAGRAISAAPLDASSTVDLLRFASHWGTLCMIYAHTIDWTLAMGTAHLIAQGYAAARLSDQGGLEEFFAGTSATPDNDKHRIIEDLIRRTQSYEKDFYQCFPRDDFVKAWMAQPGAFIANAEESLDILSDPHSRKGVWGP